MAAISDAQIWQEIESSQADFDLARKLTEADLAQAGMLNDLPFARVEKKVELTSGMPLLQDIEDNEEPTVDAVAAFFDANSYNAQYVRYMKCQALAALVAFTEGWSAFEEMVLKTYVAERKRENSEYRGDDPNKAFSLRVKQQAAEDFVRFIRGMINEAINTPKPVLAAK